MRGVRMRHAPLYELARHGVAVLTLPQVRQGRDAEAGSLGAPERREARDHLGLLGFREDHEGGFEHCPGVRSIVLSDRPIQVLGGLVLASAVSHEACMPRVDGSEVPIGVGVVGNGMRSTDDHQADDERRPGGRQGDGHKLGQCGSICASPSSCPRKRPQRRTGPGPMATAVTRCPNSALAGKSCAPMG